MYIKSRKSLCVNECSFWGKVVLFKISENIETFVQLQKQKTVFNKESA